MYLYVKLSENAVSSNAHYENKDNYHTNVDLKLSLFHSVTA